MIYLDNAATSWPKPKQVLEAMEKAVVNFGANPGRGNHQGSMDIARIVYRTREALAELFGIKDPNRIVFTSNATHALNLGIQGFLEPGDHVITSSMEHNSVWRPLKHLEVQGIELDVAACDELGQIAPRTIEGLLKPNTKLIVLTHASNVTGTLLPVTQIGEIAKQHNVVFMVDAAQTAGVFPIDVEKMNIGLLAFPGHKGLMGPQGTGGLYIAPGINLKPIFHGGTGSSSELDFQPEVLPDRYESGTLNAVGIAGLGAGVTYLLKQGINNLRERELHICNQLTNSLANIPGVVIYGPKDINCKVPVVSINIGNTDSTEIGFILDRAFNIAVRAGLHCAPQAHRTIGTLAQGTVRFSPSHFTTEQEIITAITAVNEIGREMQG
jgi:cysteine desulfurase / selenocysteine lyase